MIVGDLVCDERYARHEFSEFMELFLREAQARHLIEVGADAGLVRARRLAPFVGSLTAVMFQSDVEHAASVGGLEDLPDNLTVVGMNALGLGKLGVKADIVLVHNVLLDMTGEDTKKIWAHRRREIDCSQDEINRLRENFKKAFVGGYGVFMDVSTPGFTIDFSRAEQSAELVTMLESEHGVTADRIASFPLQYDSSHFFIDPSVEWRIVIIDNRPAA